MQIELPHPCGVAISELHPNETGYHCASCSKQVTDYTNMSDQQFIAYINKYGFGCGSFRDDQLNRKIKTRKPLLRVKLFYASLMTFALMKSPGAYAQTRPPVEQHPEGKRGIDSTTIIEINLQPQPKQLPVTRKLGTANVSTIGVWVKREPRIIFTARFPFVKINRVKKRSLTLK